MGSWACISQSGNCKPVGFRSGEKIKHLRLFWWLRGSHALHLTNPTFSWSPVERASYGSVRSVYSASRALAGVDLFDIWGIILVYP